MSTTAERDRKAAASQKRLDKYETDIKIMSAKLQHLALLLAREKEHLAWVEAMPVEDAPPPRTEPTRPPAVAIQPGATS